jgi:hypothetical protein
MVDYRNGDFAKHMGSEIMLRSETLNRVSNSYRKGYYAGYKSNPKTKPVKDSHENPETPQHFSDKPFADYDYSEGFHAGANDCYWANERS